MPSTDATIIQASAKHVPTLTPGDVSPSILMDWANACGYFFEERDIDDAKKVAKILSGLQDPLLRDWIAGDAARIKALDWDSFLEELKLQTLPEHWAQDARNDLLRLRQKDSEAFRTFAIQVEKLNVVLRGTTEHFTPTALRMQFEVAVCDDLSSQMRINRAELQAYSDYGKWKNAIITLDNRRINENSRVARLIRASSSQGYKSTSSSTHTARNASASSAPPAAAPAGTPDNPPRLTDAERALLRENAGCFKCRRFYVSHMSGKCPHGAPPALGYKTRTQADADAAKRAAGRTNVAAITEDLADAIGAVRVDSPIAGVLGDGSDSSDDDYVRRPLSSPHITWNALILCPDIPSTSLRALPMLIDTGSPTVLIRDSVVSAHHLRRRPLPTPYRMGNAWNSGLCEATEFVKLRLSSPCSTWFSKSVRAIVVPHLCAPVILGLPFLQSNSLVFDASASPPSLVHKPSSIDILHIPEPRPPPPLPTDTSPLQRRRTHRAILALTDPEHPTLCEPLSYFRDLRARRLDRNLEILHRIKLANSSRPVVTAQPSNNMPLPVETTTAHTLKSTPCPVDGPTQSDTNPADREGRGVETSNTNPPDPVFVSNIDSPTIPPVPAPSSCSVTVEEISDVDDVRVPTHRSLDLDQPILAHIDDNLDPVVSPSSPLPSSTPAPSSTSSSSSASPSPAPPTIMDDTDSHDSLDDIIASVRERIEDLAQLERFAREDAAMKEKFADRFPDDIPHLNHLPTDVYHRIRLKDPNVIIARRKYDCPKKYYEVWKELLQEHLDAGRLRPSSSPYASPAFLVPKSDPTAKPRWVNDYRALNDNTVPDQHPLPSITEILADCGKGKIWGKLDMTNSFYQTRVHPDDIQYTAITTPFGLYEWTVMPQGGRNAPATHQRRMFAALRPFIGSICHVYMDDIIIWSQTIDEHRRNVELVLEALRAHSLFASTKKTILFATQLDFLGHRISTRGIEADPKKVEKIIHWPVPASAHDVRAFLGLVRYVDRFLPHLADHTVILTPLTTKEAERTFPEWTNAHQSAFDAIKQLVVSADCLTTIDHDNMGENKIFIHTDASDWRTGAMLSYGPSRDNARPVAFDSQQLNPAEKNYTVRDKELLAIVRALRRWRVDLLGERVEVYTDHASLVHFKTQKEVNRRQSRWQNLMSDYDFDIHYIPGEENAAADALSRLPSDDELVASYAHAPVGRLRVATDPEWTKLLRSGYDKDPWCQQIRELRGTAGISENNGLWYVGDRLVIPRVPDIREALFRLAHDALGHFGIDKSYASLRDTYYWPKMRRDLERYYIPSCDDCQRNKSATHKPTGPLHPLPVPDARGDSVAIDFVGPLPEDQGYDFLVTMTDRLNSDLRIVPCRTDITAEQFAALFFDHWYCENGLPLEIVSDRDKLWISAFWKALHKLTGTKLKMSTSYHPQTDGASERSNKTVVQTLRYHVDRSQRGWVRALPRIRFQIMNTVNASTGFSPFQLHTGRSPRLIPPLLDEPAGTDGDPEFDAAKFISRLQDDVNEARDNLTMAKTTQATQANRHRGPEHTYAVDDLVMLSTFNRRREYMQTGDKRVGKFMVRFDGPYRVLRANPESSVYTLDLPKNMRIFPTFHASLLKPYHANRADLFPGRHLPKPGPIVTPDGVEEWTVERIVDRRTRGRGHQYLLRWEGWGPGADSWVPGAVARELAAYDRWLESHPEDGE